MGRIRFYLCLFVISLSIACVFLRPMRECNVKSMLLTDNDFPIGTLIGDISSPIAEMPNESAGFSAGYRGSAMYHEIGRYPSSASAEREFDEIGMRAFIQTEYEGPWETPAEVSYRSSIFQKYHVACGKKYDEKYQCRMIGQYDEYYVFFFAYISENGINFNILNDLLKKIDAHMEQCLK